MDLSTTTTDVTDFNIVLRPPGKKIFHSVVFKKYPETADNHFFSAISLRIKLFSWCNQDIIIQKSQNSHRRYFAGDDRGSIKKRSNVVFLRQKDID